MKVTLLGTGPSAGVPFIACTCPVCTSKNSKNKRLRVSAYIEIGDHKLLIDTSPDMRQQALNHKINRVDAVLFTHAHADHVHGIDDMRSFNYLADDVIPVYADSVTMENLQRRFGYVFQPRPEPIWSRAALVPNIIPDVPVSYFSYKDLEITAIKQGHGGKIHSLGYRIGNFAYSTDVCHLSEEAFAALKDLDIWVVDCLRYRPSPTHANLEMTLEWIKRVKPKRAVLTHMSHEFDYDALAAELPSGVVPGYDGMMLEL